MADSSEYDLAPLPKDSPKPRQPLPPSAPVQPSTSPFFEEEDEGLEDDPTKPQPPPRTAPKPLPRILKTAPLTIEEAQAEAESKAKAKAAADSPIVREGTVRGKSATAPVRKSKETDRPSASRDKVDGEGRKIEATPELDTYETRQRIRAVLGLLASGAVILAIFMVVRSFSGGGSGSAEEMIVINEADLLGPQFPNKSAPNVTNKAQEPTGPLEAQAPTNTDPITDPTPAQEPNYLASEPEPEPAPEVLTADRPSLPTGPLDLSPQLPEGFRAAEGAELHESGWPWKIVCERDDSTMVLIPAGTYLIGRNEGSPSEAPAHRVRMPSYYIDVHEVTVRQYERYREEMNLLGETVFPRQEDLKKVAPTEEHPVVVITASQAGKYADWVGKALPSEAQWEVAARGPDGRIHPWGAGPPAWSEDRLPRQVDPVLSYPEEDVSPFGVQDLAGNVWEWTADWYDSRHYEGRRGRIVENPGGPSQSHSSPPQITIKGSSKTWESSYREGMRPDARLPYLGFRCVLSVEGEPQIIDAPPPPTAEPTKKRQGGSRPGRPVLVPF